METCALFFGVSAHARKIQPPLWKEIAQLAERMTVNHDVAGSSPAGGAINGTRYLFRFFVLRKPPDSLGVQCSFSDEK